MNIRKPADFTAMFCGLNEIVQQQLPQMEMYCEIGRLISARPEKGAAVAAAEYLRSVFPDLSGFSPRNVRRMRDFYRAYEHTPDLMAEALEIGWTQNVVIMESCETDSARAWYLRAARKHQWSKAELQAKIRIGPYWDTSANNSPEISNSKIEKAESSFPHETGIAYLPQQCLPPFDSGAYQMCHAGSLGAAQSPIHNCQQRSVRNFSFSADQENTELAWRLLQDAFSRTVSFCRPPRSACRSSQSQIYTGGACINFPVPVLHDTPSVQRPPGVRFRFKE